MGCAECAKYFLCFFNFAFFVAGGTALTVGIWLFADSASFLNFIGKIDESNTLNKTDAEVIKSMTYILVITGALTFIVSFFGYCGAVFESRCLLCGYGILISLVLALECTTIGLAYGLQGERFEDTERNVQGYLKTTLKYYANSVDKTETVTMAWDGIMNQLHCCGVENYLDFQESPNWMATGKVIPESCCIKENNALKDPSCVISPAPSNSYYQQGCYHAILNLIQANSTIVISVIAGLIVLEFFLIIMAIYLACCHWRPQHVLTCCC